MGPGSVQKRLSLPGAVSSIRRRVTGKVAVVKALIGNPYQQDMLMNKFCFVPVGIEVGGKDALERCKKNQY